MPGIGPGSRAGKPCRDHLGNEFKSESEMCRHWGIGTGAYCSRRRRGMDLEHALTDPMKSGPAIPCKDHKGAEYPSRTAMLKAYGINYTIYHYRHDVKGWSLADALETPVTDTDLAGAHACTDHMGNRFPSKKAMCEHWHVPRNVFFLRKKEGKTLAECLAPVDRAHEANAVRDHEGTPFRSLDEMCASWGIAKSDYIQNIRNGLPLPRALTERTARPEKPKDHLGTEYPSINAMCRAWGIDKTVLRSRLELGWTLEQILTHPENNSHTIKCRDHLGKEYQTQKEMLRAWNVTYATYKHRLKKGRSLAEALDPGSLHALPVTDHEGRTFPCLQAMLDYWCALTPNYHHRMSSQGMDMRSALSERTVGQVLPCGIRIDGRSGRWYTVEHAGQKMVVSPPVLDRMARGISLRNEISAGTLPDGMRARYLGRGWFQVWGTDGTGPSPGAAMPQDRAWLERCLHKYRQKPKKSVR